MRPSVRLRLATSALAVWIAFAGPATAEPPPEPPLIAALPLVCAWTIDVQQKRPRQPPPADPKAAAVYKRMLDASPRMIRVSTERAGENAHKETFWEDGKTDSLWIYNGWVILKPVNYPVNQVTAMPMHSRLSPVKDGLGADFPDLVWLTSETFVKTEPYHGQSCHYYEDKNASALQGGDALNPNIPKGVRAWIDAKTRLPVAVEDDAVIKKFHFIKNPPEKLEPTGAFAVAYDEATKRHAGNEEAAPKE